MVIIETILILLIGICLGARMAYTAGIEHGITQRNTEIEAIWNKTGKCQFTPEGMPHY